MPNDDLSCLDRVFGVSCENCFTSSQQGKRYYPTFRPAGPGTSDELDPEATSLTKLLNTSILEVLDLHIGRFDHHI